jgi:transcriptional regulator with XRE-family HTH domain
VAQPGFGQRLRAARQARGLSQTDLADEDVSASYVSLLESGKREPRSAVVDKLAQRLGVDAQELMTGVTKQREQAARTALALAEVAVADGRPDDAAAAFEALMDSPDLGPADRQRAQLGLAHAAERRGDLAAAVALLEELRGRFDEQLSDGGVWLSVAVSLSRCYREAGDLARAVDVAAQGLERCEAVGLPRPEARARLVATLAAAHAERGDLLRAASLLDELIAQTDASGTREERGAAYWNASLVAAHRGFPGEALRLAERAAALMAEDDDERSIARLKITRAYLLMAQPLPDPARARSLLDDAMPALRRHAGQVDLASAETELAKAELLSGNPAGARFQAQSALSRLGDGSRLEAASTLVVLGSAQLAEGTQNEGMATLEQAAERLDGAGATRQAALVWRQLAEAYQDAGDGARALSAFRRALDDVGVRAQLVLEPATVGQTPVGLAGPTVEATARP